jgi:hypothetical protein
LGRGASGAASREATRGGLVATRARLINKYRGNTKEEEEEEEENEQIIIREINNKQQ